MGVIFFLFLGLVCIKSTINTVLHWLMGMSILECMKSTNNSATPQNLIILQCISKSPFQTVWNTSFIHIHAWYFFRIPIFWTFFTCIFIGYITTCNLIQFFMLFNGHNFHFVWFQDFCYILKVLNICPLFILDIHVKMLLGIDLWKVQIVCLKKKLSKNHVIFHRVLTINLHVAWMLWWPK